ncbi:MAG: protein kinase [Myxococcaceae bacterium]
MSCPDTETLARHAEAGLDAATAEKVREHVDGCATCRELLVTLVRTSRPTPGAHADLPWDVPLPGTLIGRYRVTGTRGAGGMGVVLAAYDPQLDRQVALKVLRPDLSTESPEQSKLRLVREAQLMARVRHANVVTVHDVVLDGERVFIAMELVEGQTLRDWLEAAPRSADDILERFVAAGRGLAAAHSAGVVHRDFKPDNVLLDARGEVLVSDFGLAWSETAAPLPPGLDGASPLDRGSLAVGTPAYMAPEQLKRERIDARADQYSFCVALWEALQRERPFDEHGQLKSPKRAMPRRVETALRRGLSIAPEARFASMEDLLVPLVPSQARTRAWAIAAAAVLLLAGGLGVRWREQAARCEGPRAQLASAWTPSRLPGAESPAGGPSLRDGLVRQVEGLRAALSSSWDAACGGADERLRTCLQARIDSFAVTTSVLSQRMAEPRVSTALINRVDGPEGCLAGEVLTLLPVPAGGEAAARDARVQALTADALRFAGDLDGAERTAQEAIELAVASTWRPAEADARLSLAQVYRARGRFKEAEAVLGDALLAAEAGRHFEAIARIAVQHVLVVGTQTNRPDDAEPWVKRAEAALEQLPRPRLRAEVDVALSMLRVAQGRFDDAMAVSDRALGWLESRDAVSAADLHALRALNLLQFGLDAQALDEANQAVEARVRLLGENHPLTLHARIAQGEANARLGHTEVALQQLTSALEVAREKKSVNSVSQATALVAMSLALDQAGRKDEAVAAAREADELVRKALGPAHRYVALSTRALGERLFSAGKTEEGLQAMDSALEIGTAAVGEKHRETLETRARRAVMWATLGRAEARRRRSSSSMRSRRRRVTRRCARGEEGARARAVTPLPPCGARAGRGLG